MYRIVIYIFSIGLLYSCTEMNVEESLPDISVLKPDNTEMTLPRLNIVGDSAELEELLRRYESNLFVDVTLDYYTESGDVIFKDFKAVTETRGRSSIYKDMKPLGFDFESTLDNSTYQLLPQSKILEGDNVDVLNTCRVRNSGNDFGFTAIKDLTFTQLAIDVDLNVELKYGSPLQVFLNGDYYGFMCVRSEANQLAISDLIGIDADRITTVKVDPDNLNLEYKRGNEQHAERLRGAIKNRDLEEMQKLIDVDNYIDYILFEDYLGNDDWPNNNVRAYAVDEGPFRFIVFDLDQAAVRSKNAHLPQLEYRDEDVAKIYQTFFFKDDTFEARLRERQKELYSVWSGEMYAEILDKTAARIKNEMPYFIAKYKAPASMLEWDLYMQKLKHDFKNRDVFLRDKYKLN